MAALDYAAKTWGNYFPGGATHPGAQANFDALPQYLKDEANAQGGGPSASDLSPAGLADIFRQPDVALPRADEAKGALRDLQMGGTTGLSKLLEQDPYANRDRIASAMYDNAAEGINYEADRQSQAVKEGQNAKNMLYSTGTSYFLDPIERGRSIGLGKAKNDSYVQAGAEGRADYNTQLTALGQAFNQGTSGLTAEAGVEAANRNANQTATQAGYQTGAQLGENAASRAQQESQFGRSLTQQKDLQEAGFANARDIAGSAGLSSLIGGGLSGLSRFFGPAANNALANTFPIFKGSA